MENGFGGAVGFLAEVPPRNESVTAQLSEDVFSKMIYENICPGEDQLYSSNSQWRRGCDQLPSSLLTSQPVVLFCSGEFFGMRKEVVLEPLVGHLRHPYGLPACIPDGAQVYHYQPDQS